MGSLHEAHASRRQHKSARTDNIPQVQQHCRAVQQYFDKILSSTTSAGVFVREGNTGKAGQLEGTGLNTRSFTRRRPLFLHGRGAQAACTPPKLKTPLYRNYCNMMTSDTAAAYAYPLAVPTRRKLPADLTLDSNTRDSLAVRNLWLSLDRNGSGHHRAARKPVRCWFLPKELDLGRPFRAAVRRSSYHVNGARPARATTPAVVNFSLQCGGKHTRKLCRFVSRRVMLLLCRVLCRVEPHRNY